ncbi:MAG: amidase [Thermomicrobiales bacterium]|nr:amidase [Thermomicrobiales bacterium]
MAANDLCFSTARELADRLRHREISAREVMSAHLAQIERVNPQVNAIVSKLDDERALRLADTADRALSAGDPVGPLHGLPIAFKDLDDAVGFPTTKGSPIYRDHYPARDSLLVERLRKAGALGIGKTNVPEFGLGSHTFNPVFGATHNPYDLTKSAGGSSGGAGAALATGMLPIADGSDMGGSLRNPGNFNNVVGFRPSPGLVPSWPSSAPWMGLSVKGPLARTVGDVALILTAIVGADPRDQGALPIPPDTFAQPLDRDLRGVRIAWCPDLGGLPLDPRVRAALEAQRHVFADLGCTVEEAAPDLTGADEIFLTLRAFLNATGHEDDLRDHRDLMKPEAVWNAEEGMKLGAVDVGRAMARQADLFERVRQFMERYDFFLCAVNQVPPFDIDLRYPTEIDGVPMENYIAWMKTAYWVTVTRSPAISVPCGFTPDGLPVGIQIVGRFRDDLGVLQLAHAFESTTQVWQRRPPIAG